MVRAVRKRVRVGKGGTIEVRDADLPEGADAEVIVLVSDLSADEALSHLTEPSPFPLTEIVGSGTGLFAHPDEVDRRIRTLRNEWD